VLNTLLKRIKAKRLYAIPSNDMLVNHIDFLKSATGAVKLASSDTAEFEYADQPHMTINFRERRNIKLQLKRTKIKRWEASRVNSKVYQNWPDYHNSA
jgi:hypothetical protein